MLEIYRRGMYPQTRLRAHVLLLLDDGQPWALMAAVLYTTGDDVCWTTVLRRCSNRPDREAVGGVSW
jgi:hypothetical protein